MAKSFYVMIKVFAALGVTKLRWHFIGYIRKMLQPKVLFSFLPNLSFAVTVPN
jgi:hypothetical protein